MAHMTEVICGNKKCKKPFMARTADVKRGWGKYCSKSCKAFRQTQLTGIAGPDYRADGRNVNQMRNGHYAKSKLNGRPPGNGERWYPTIVSFEPWDEEVENGDVKYSHRHGCWLVRDYGDDPLIDAHPFDSDAAGFNNT